MGKGTDLRAEIGVVPPEFYSAIGQLIVAWGQLEQGIHAAMRSLAGVSESELGRLLTLNLSASAAIETLGALAKYKLSESDFALFKDKILSGLRATRDFRNKIGHAVWWTPDDQRRAPHRESFKRYRTDPELEPVTLEELRRFTAKIRELHADLYVFLHEHGFPMLAP